MNKALRRARIALDGRLAPLRPSGRFVAPPKGWIRAIRDAIGMSGAQLARRMSITPQSVVDLEKSEVAATVRLATLRKAAYALDCTLVYALVPNQPLEEIVQRRARQIASHELGGVAHTMSLENQSVPNDDLDTRIQEFVDNTLRDRDLWDGA